MSGAIQIRVIFPLFVYNLNKKDNASANCEWRIKHTTCPWNRTYIVFRY